MQLNTIKVLLSPPACPSLRALNHRYAADFVKITESDLASCVLMGGLEDMEAFWCNLNGCVLTTLEDLEDARYTQNKGTLLTEASNYFSELLEGPTLKNYYHEFASDVRALMGPENWSLTKIIDCERPSGMLVRFEV